MATNRLTSTPPDRDPIGPSRAASPRGRRRPRPPWSTRLRPTALSRRLSCEALIFTGSPRRTARPKWTFGYGSWGTSRHDVAPLSCRRADVPERSAPAGSAMGPGSGGVRCPAGTWFPQQRLLALPDGAVVVEPGGDLHIRHRPTPGRAAVGTGLPADSGQRRRHRSARVGFGAFAVAVPYDDVPPAPWLSVAHHPSRVRAVELTVIATYPASATDAGATPRSLELVARRSQHRSWRGSGGRHWDPRPTF